MNRPDFSQTFPKIFFRRFEFLKKKILPVTAGGHGVVVLACTSDLNLKYVKYCTMKTVNIGLTLVVKK